MTQKPKPIREHIIDVLREGKELTTSEITISVAKTSRKILTATNVANHLAKMMNTQLGKFITKERESTKKNSYVYKMNRNAQNFTPEQTYALSLQKKGKRILQSLKGAKPHLRLNLRKLPQDEIQDDPKEMLEPITSEELEEEAPDYHLRDFLKEVAGMVARDEVKVKVKVRVQVK